MFPKIGGFPPKSSILIGFSLINHPFWGTPYFRKHPYTKKKQHPLLGRASSNFTWQFSCFQKTVWKRSWRLQWINSLGYGGIVATLVNVVHGHLPAQIYWEVDMLHTSFLILLDFKYRMREFQENTKVLSKCNISQLSDSPSNHETDQLPKSLLVTKPWKPQFMAVSCKIGLYRPPHLVVSRGGGLVETFHTWSVWCLVTQNLETWCLWLPSFGGGVAPCMCLVGKDWQRFPT